MGLQSKRSWMLALLIAPLAAARAQAPEAIAVTGETLVATIHAEGAQIYEGKADTAGKLVWQFREPIATLLVDGKTVGRHYAGPNWELADGSAVVGKVSGIVASAKPKEWKAEDLAPVINHTMEVFGPDRVMFGGDWPVCTMTSTYKQWVEALKQIVRDRKDEEQKKLFHDNAVKFYGLK